MDMGVSLAQLPKRNDFLNVCYETTLNTNPYVDNKQLPSIEEIIEESGVDEYQQRLHHSSREVLWEFSPFAAYLTDFSYFLSHKIHKNRLRKTSNRPYTHHLFEAAANFLENTKLPESRQDTINYAQILTGIIRHDNTEELTDDEVERQTNALSPKQKARLRKAILRDQQETYRTAIDTLAQKLNLSSNHKQELYSFEEDALIIEDKLSRGRKRRRREADTYDQYTDKSIAGKTQVFGLRSDARHELISWIVKGYESGQNGDTLFPHTGNLLADKQITDPGKRELLAQITRELQPGSVHWTEKGPVYEPGPIGKIREELEQLYEKTISNQLLEQVTDQPATSQAKQAFSQLREQHAHKEKKYREALKDHLYIIPRHSRADTIQWNAYMANAMFKSVRTASNISERRAQTTPWLLQTTKQAALNLAQKTLVHAEMQMDNDVVYNKFPITTARQIRYLAKEFQDYEESFKITSAKEKNHLPKNLRAYDQFTTLLLRAASNKQELLEEFTTKPETQFRQMAISSELCSRLLRNAYERPEDVTYARGSPDISAVE